MNRTVIGQLFYLRWAALTVKARETDDVPTILGQLFSTPSSADQHKADREPSNCEPSDDVWMYINRQRTSKMKWARLARTHFAALSACEDGFPGYARQEILVQRAMARASTVIYYPKEMHTDIMKEMESLGDWLASKNPTDLLSDSRLSQRVLSPPNDRHQRGR